MIKESILTLIQEWDNPTSRDFDGRMEITRKTSEYSFEVNKIAKGGRHRWSWSCAKFIKNSNGSTSRCESVFKSEGTAKSKREAQERAIRVIKYYERNCE